MSYLLLDDPVHRSSQLCHLRVQVHIRFEMLLRFFPHCC